MGFRVRQPGPTDKAPRSGKKIRFEISGKGVERSCVWLRGPDWRGAVGSPIGALHRPGGFNGAAFADGVASGRPVTSRSNWRGETNGRLRWLLGNSRAVPAAAFCGSPEKNATCIRDAGRVADAALRFCGVEQNLAGNYFGGVGVRVDQRVSLALCALA